MTPFTVDFFRMQNDWEIGAGGGFARMYKPKEMTK